MPSASSLACMSVIQLFSNSRAVREISGPMTERAKRQLWNARSEPDVTCMILPALSVRDAWSKTNAQFDARMAGPEFEWPTRGERPACVMFVYTKVEGSALTWWSSPQFCPALYAVKVTGESAVPSDWIDPATSMSVPFVPEETPSISTSVPG